MNRIAQAGFALGLATAPAHAAPPILIAGARVFDGTGAPARVGDVLVEGDRIVAVGPKLKAPRGAKRIDGRGKTLIPGLHDLHTHLRSPALDAPEDLGKAWAAYLLAGVTTVNDYSVSGEMIAPIRALTSPGGPLWAPHLNQAVRFGVPGGHGTEFGWGHFFTMQAATPRAAHQLTPLALGYDPDVIKVFADGWRYGRDPDLNSMNEPTLAAIVHDAHAAGKPVVTHTVTLEGAKVAASAGVDALGHGVGDAPVDDELIALMRRNGTGYIGTTTVFEPQQTRVFSSGERALFNNDERGNEEAARADNPEPVLAYDSKRWAILNANIRALKAAGIPIGIGTDAGIGGVYHGSSAQREIRILVANGFTPAEALIAATRTSAALMHQEHDHGTIEAGMRADLVLVDGKPDEDIDDLWHIDRVWVGGREAPLAELRKLRDAPGMTPMPVHVMPGPVITGARGDGRTDLDTLPVATTDPGVDHSCLVAHQDEQHDHTGHDHATFLAAQMGAAPRPYVEWVLPLTRGTIEVADASRFAGIELAVRGRGEYHLILESYGLRGESWFRAPFTASATGDVIRIPFSAFVSRDARAKLDLAQLRALRVVLHGETGGTNSLELGAVRFY
jgi:imidazolonepropionase-like amidohydrolase